MTAFCPEHPKWDQNPKFTPLSKTTSIPTPFIFGVRFLHTVIKNIAITVRETQVMKAGKHWSWKLPDRAQSFVFCSQVVTEYSLFYFLFKVHPAQGGSGGGRKKYFFIFLSRTPCLLSHARFTHELANVSEKNEKKNKTTSVYRLDWII